MKRLLDEFHSMRAALHLAPPPRPRAQRLHAALFVGPKDCLGATRALHEDGFEIEEVYSPFPVHGIEDAMGLQKTRLGWCTLVGGAIGGLGAFLLQTWIHAVDWPMNIGGKSYVAFPSQFVVAFELTVLVAAFATVGGLLCRSRLRPRWHSDTGPGQPTMSITDDRFVVLVRETDASFRSDRFQAHCREHNALEVRESWRV